MVKKNTLRMDESMSHASNLTEMGQLADEIASTMRLLVVVHRLEGI